MARPATIWTGATRPSSLVEQTESRPASVLVRGDEQGQGQPGAIGPTQGVTRVALAECEGNVLGISDAIMRPSIEWVQGYESRPQANGRGTFRAGGFTFVESGGRSGGGYAVSVANPAGTGQFDCLEINSVDDPEYPIVRKRGGTFAFDLATLMPGVVTDIYAIGQKGDVAHPGFVPAVSVRINADRTITLRGYRRVAGLLVYGDMTAPSSLVLPLTGFCQGELQAGIGPAFNPTGGFALLNMQIDDVTGPQGVLVHSLVGVELAGGVLWDVAWGTAVECFWPDTTKHGYDGLKVDDVTVYGSRGTVKRFLHDTRVLALRPNGPGDASPGRVSWDSRATVNPGGGAGAGDLAIGCLTEYGDPEHWRNLVGNDRPDDEQLHQLGIFVAGDLGASLDYGLLNTSPAWIEGPHLPPLYADLSPFDIAAENLIKRLTLDGEAPEYVTVGHDRTDVAAVEGLFPFVRHGMRWLIAAIRQTNIGGLGWGLINMVSAISLYDDLFVDYPSVGSRSWLRTIIRRNGVDRESSTFAHITSQVWSTRAGYDLGAPSSVINGAPSFSPTRPDDGQPYEPADLRGPVQIGVRGDLTVYDALGGPPEHRFSMIDVIELGAEAAYHPTAIVPEEHPPFPPHAWFVVTALDTDALVITIRDASEDWDGTVVSRMVDWGDGSPLEALPAYPGTLTHTYGVAGTKTITNTVTDNDGLTDAASRDIDVFTPNTAPTPGFTFAVDPGDPSGMTVNFTDISTDDFGIGGWEYDFGDGSPHGFAQNPSHTYAAPGTYTVRQTVTDIGGPGGQAPISAYVEDDVTVPIEIPDPTACEFFPETPPGSWVQGDDFNGGNPPIPNYSTKAELDLWYGATNTDYGGVHFRKLYEYSDGPGSSYDLDPTVLSNGKKTLKATLGTGNLGYYIGTYYASDGSPEVLPPNAALYDAANDDPGLGANNWPLRYWDLIRFKGEAGLMSDATRTTAQTGLALGELDASNSVGGLYLRQGKVKLDIKAFATAVVGFRTTYTYDVCDESVILTGEAGVFKDILQLMEVNEYTHEHRHRVWVVDACGLPGSDPILDVTVPAYRAMGFYFGVNFNYAFTLSANGSPGKHFWLAGVRKEPGYKDGAVNNPFGVNL